MYIIFTNRHWMFCFSDWTHFHHGICLAFDKKKVFLTLSSILLTCHLSFRGAFALYAHQCVVCLWGLFIQVSFFNQGTPSTEPSTTHEIGSHSGPHIGWHWLPRPSTPNAQTSQPARSLWPWAFLCPKRIQDHLLTIDGVSHNYIHLILTLLLKRWWVRPGFSRGLVEKPPSFPAPLCHHRSITPNQRTLFPKKSYNITYKYLL